MARMTVAVATYNEEKNLAACLDSVKDIASEIVIVDGSSTDRTVEIAKKYGAKVMVTDNPPIFHINKQKALDASSGPWILQLDADERVSAQLAKEIQKVIAMSDEEILSYQDSLPLKKLFLRHQEILEKRDGKIGMHKNNFTAFFIPRANFFLGRYLRYGGVYPDGVIRLVKKGFAHFPCKDVHEQIVVSGRVGWLQHDLIHMADPTFVRYLERNKRYVKLLAAQLEEEQIDKEKFAALKYLFFLPAWWFGLTFIRHKGFKDSWQGLVFSFFSALRFPKAYLLYRKNLRH